MSTSYGTMPVQKIRAADLLDRRLEELGVREQPSEDTTDKKKCLTDGRNYLWIYVDDDGFVNRLVRYASNGSPYEILRVIEQAFDTEIFSEHQPQYWGFDSEQAWDAWMEEGNRKAIDEFYGELIKFASGHANNIRAGTIGCIQAEIAKKLITNDPRLLLPEERNRLMENVEAIWQKDHCVTVTLSEEDVAFAQLIGAREDDLGRA